MASDKNEGLATLRPLSCSLLKTFWENKREQTSGFKYGSSYFPRGFSKHILHKEEVDSNPNKGYLFKSAK